MLGPHLFRPQRCPCHPRGVLLKSSRPTSIGCTGLNSRELILSKLRSCNCMILSESEARWCWVTCLALPTTSCSRALTPGLLYLLRGLLLIYTLLMRVTKLLCSSCGRVTWPSCPSAAAACHHWSQSCSARAPRALMVPDRRSCAGHGAQAQSCEAACTVSETHTSLWKNL